MSNQRVNRVSKKIPYTATYANGVFTVVTSSTHGLASDDVVNVNGSKSSLALSSQVVTVVDTTTFTFPYIFTDIAHSLLYLTGTVEIGLFRTGVTGRQIVSLGAMNGDPIVFQSWVTGTGTAVYAFELSLDGVHWVTAATVTHTATSGDTQFQTVAPSWVYAAINITSIGASTSLEILYTA